MKMKKMAMFLCVFTLLLGACGNAEQLPLPQTPDLEETFAPGELPTEGEEMADDMTSSETPEPDGAQETVIIPEQIEQSDDAELPTEKPESSGVAVEKTESGEALAEAPDSTETKTEAPESTEALTGVPGATSAPADSPLTTAAPELLPEPTATPEPVKEPTTTPTYTTLPPTPTPRPDVTPIPGKYNQRQIGDDVWCRVYENGVMHVVGSGSTWDYESHVEAYNKLSMLEGYRLRGKTVIVEEGITRIGDFGLAYMQSATKIILPSSLKELGECAFYGSGSYDGCTWEGLTPEKWKMQENSLLNGRDLDKVPEYAKYCQVFVPAADPDNPKLRHTMQMGDNVWLEFWDNGYLYVKGTGKMWNKSDIFCLYSSYQNEEGVLREVCDTITHVVVEEGITYIGNQNFLGIGKVEECWLPSTLEKIAVKKVGVCFQTGIEPKILHCYYEGEPITIEVLYKYGRDMCNPFELLDRIKYPEKYWDSLEWYEQNELKEYRIIPEEEQA